MGLPEPSSNGSGSHVREEETLQRILSRGSACSERLSVSRCGDVRDSDVNDLSESELRGALVGERTQNTILMEEIAHLRRQTARISLQTEAEEDQIANACHRRLVDAYNVIDTLQHRLVEAESALQDLRHQDDKDQERSMMDSSEAKQDCLANLVMRRLPLDGASVRRTASLRSLPALPSSSLKVAIARRLPFTALSRWKPDETSYLEQYSSRRRLSADCHNFDRSGNYLEIWGTGNGKNAQNSATTGDVPYTTGPSLSSSLNGIPFASSGNLDQPPGSMHRDIMLRRHPLSREYSEGVSLNSSVRSHSVKGNSSMKFGGRLSATEKPPNASRIPTPPNLAVAQLQVEHDSGPVPPIRGSSVTSAASRGPASPRSPALIPRWGVPARSEPISVDFSSQSVTTPMSQHSPLTATLPNSGLLSAEDWSNPIRKGLGVFDEENSDDSSREEA